MPTELTAEQQAAFCEETRRNIVRLRAIACTLEGGAMEADNDEDRDFIRGLADNRRNGADELEAALDSGESTETIGAIWRKLLRGPVLAMLTGDISKANITPRQD